MRETKRFATMAAIAAFAVVSCFNGWAAEVTPQGSVAQKYLSIQAKRKPDDAWKTYETRAMDLLPGFAPRADEIKTDKYGGRLDKKGKATGFFRAEKQGDRWWLIDPDGHPFIHVGVCSVSPGRSKTNAAALQSKFGAPAKWAEATTQLLWDTGFNGIGGWSDAATLRQASRPMPYTLSMSFMSSFGGSKKLTFTQPGHSGYPNGCIPVFHPEFEAFCDNYAKPLAATKDDLFLIGHFSDNELPSSKDLLDRFLSLDANDPNLGPNRRAAQEWFEKRKGAAATIKDATDVDRQAFTEYVYDRYFEITTRAIRKYDPNHLCLGSRLYGAALQDKSIFRAAGRYLDVIALNYYGAWGPDPARLAMWTAESGKPVMITEFYAKGADSGYKNTTGAGWLVPTQKDRGLFYQNFVLGLLESRTCVGWHWFKYMDNDPEDLRADPSNRDSNKGIVTIKYEPYTALLDVMKPLNGNVYAIIQYFDSKRQ
jgi:hypothetical protein